MCNGGFCVYGTLLLPGRMRVPPSHFLTVMAVPRHLWGLGAWTLHPLTPLAASGGSLPVMANHWKPAKVFTQGCIQGARLQVHWCQLKADWSSSLSLIDIQGISMDYDKLGQSV